MFSSMMTIVDHVLPANANEVHADFAKPNSIMALFSLFGISVIPLLVGMISRADAAACLVTAMVQGGFRCRKVIAGFRELCPL
jgi:hypothetical protein